MSANQGTKDGRTKRPAWRKIAGSLAGVVTFLALLVTILQLRQDIKDSKAADAANATVIALLAAQVQVQEEVATVQMSSVKTGPAATAVAQELVRLVSTRDALEEEGRQARATLAAIASNVAIQPSPILESTRMPQASPPVSPIPTTVPTLIPSPTLEEVVTQWFVPADWSNHTEYASCPGYPPIQSFGFISPGVVELTSEAAKVDGDLMEWCFTIRFTRLAWWVKYYQENQPQRFGTTEPESLAVYFWQLPAGMWVEVEGVGQVLPAGSGQAGVSVKNSPITFHVFMPVGMPTYRFHSGPYLPGEPAVVIP